MLSNLHPPSELRQMLDIIGAQLAEPKADPVLLMTTCRNILFAADGKKPLPDDVFAPGVNDAVLAQGQARAAMRK
jgi:hypothetical protein